MKEEWRTYKTRQSDLLISNLGNVKGTMNKKSIEISIINGRRCISSKWKIFRLVWIAFNGPIPKGYCIHHIDFDKTNDRLDNLQLMTNAEHTALHNKFRHNTLNYKWYNNKKENRRFRTDVEAFALGYFFKGRINLQKRTSYSTLSEETKKKISESLTGRTPWNKGLTKETDKRLAKSGETWKNNRKNKHQNELAQCISNK